MAEDDEPLGAPVTRAEFMLQCLLDRQLATSGRLEQVEFKEASKALYRGIHGSGGVSTLEEFRAQQNEAIIEEPKQECCERKRYGPDPAFLQSQDREQRKELCSRESSANEKQLMGRHEKELEISLIKGKGKLQAIAHLTVEGVSWRKPLTELSVVCEGTTPEERARLSSGKDATRSASEVFSSSAPPLLDLDTYLEEGTQDAHTELNNEDPPVVTDEAIISNRLSAEQLQEWSDGKFRNHEPGLATNVLYLKNLGPEVTQEDLAALFLRFKQQPDGEGMIRLMQKGRMKGQAFVTFPDVVAATRALQLVHGYMLKGKPVIIGYARGKKNI